MVRQLAHAILLQSGAQKCELQKVCLIENSHTQYPSLPQLMRLASTLQSGSLTKRFLFSKLPGPPLLLRASTLDNDDLLS
jgi:hypothetical protein